MKKDKLIQMLSEIKGNPEIYLWNDFAEDWEDIDKKFVSCKFVKEHSRGSKWDIPNPFVESAEMSEWYVPQRKNVVIINSKVRNKMCYNRIVKFNY
jgi:hypothetical protein